MQLPVRTWYFHLEFSTWQQMCVYGAFYIHICPLRTLLTNRFSSFSLKQRNVGLADPNPNVPEFLSSS